MPPVITARLGNFGRLLSLDWVMKISPYMKQLQNQNKYKFLISTKIEKAPSLNIPEDESLCFSSLSGILSQLACFVNKLAIGQLILYNSFYQPGNLVLQ